MASGFWASLKTDGFINVVTFILKFNLKAWFPLPGGLHLTRDGVLHELMSQIDAKMLKKHKIDVSTIPAHWHIQTELSVLLHTRLEAV